MSQQSFSDADLDGATFSRVRLVGAVFERVVLNGVDVVPLVEAELDRRDPDRAAMRPTDPDGFRRAWALLEQRW